MFPARTGTCRRCGAWSREDWLREGSGLCRECVMKDSILRRITAEDERIMERILSTATPARAREELRGLRVPATHGLPKSPEYQIPRTKAFTWEP